MVGLLLFVRGEPGGWFALILANDHQEAAFFSGVVDLRLWAPQLVRKQLCKCLSCLRVLLGRQHRKFFYRLPGNRATTIKQRQDLAGAFRKRKTCQRARCSHFCRHSFELTIDFLGSNLAQASMVHGQDKRGLIVQDQEKSW